MSDDLVTRLRARQPGVLPWGTRELLDGAADEIERLRELVLDLTAQACERDGELDSMAISTYADAMRYHMSVAKVTASQARPRAER